MLKSNLFSKLCDTLHRSSLLLAAVAIVTTSLPIWGDTAKTGFDSETVNQYLKQSVETYQIPGLSAAIIQGDEVLFSKGYGEANTRVPITSETPFLMGSTTKMFTAMGIMRLAEQGRVDLDAPVIHYLPELRLNAQGFEKKITLRHLLNHTSGLSEKGMPKPALGELTLERELAALAQCSPYAEPGTHYTYFNVNYRLLGLIIQRVSGKEYGEFLEEELFNPLGMTATSAGPEGVKNLAVGNGQLFGAPLARKQSYRPGALPSGYLVSSAADLSLFLIAEMKAGAVQPGTLMPETVRQTWTPPAGIGSEYAMGWLATTDPQNRKVLVHGGSLENYQSFLYIDPKEQIGIVLLVNQGGLLPSLEFNAVLQGLIEAAHGEKPKSVPVQTAPLIIWITFAAFLALELYRTLRLKTWLKRMNPRRLWRRWSSIGLELFIAVFLAFGFFPVMNRIMGDKANWEMLYGLLPEGFFTLCIIIAFSTLRGIAKLWMLKYPPSKKHFVDCQQITP